MNTGNSKSLTMATMFVICCGLAAAEELSIEPQALQAAGLRYVQSLDPNLTGADVKIAAVCRSMSYEGNIPLGDYRFNIPHNCFLGANVLFEDGTDGKTGISDHSTAIGGVLLGLDPVGFCPQVGKFSYVGACVDASVDVYEFWRFVSLYVFAGRPFDADVLTISLGDVFGNWWTRGIEYIAESRGLLVVAAAGNGSDVYDPLLQPAAGANVIAVGTLDSPAGNTGDFRPPHSRHSSAGPTADGRCKPDLVAPGKCLVPDANSPGGYRICGNWSSLAAPITAGAAALLVQKAKDSPQLAAASDRAGGNCVIKSILLASAQKMPYWHKGLPGTQDDAIRPLDWLQGAGTLDAAGAYRILTAGRSTPAAAAQRGWDNNEINAYGQQQQRQVYCFRIEEPQGKFISAALCWNRMYQDKYPFSPMTEYDSDLRLELWAVNAQNRDRLLQYSDSANDNLEYIYCPAEPNCLDYRLVVRFSDAPSGPSPRQRYGLAWAAGPDRTGDNPYWYDLNNDGNIDSVDQLIYFLIDRGRINIIGLSTAESTLNISRQRLQILQAEWAAWRKYLDRWN